MEGDLVRFGQMPAGPRLDRGFVGDYTVAVESVAVMSPHAGRCQEVDQCVLAIQDAGVAPVVPVGLRNNGRDSRVPTFGC